MQALFHRTIYELPYHEITKSLPFIPSLLKYHKNGRFHLLEDPNITKRAAIIGMFVIRPSDLLSYHSPLPISNDTNILDSTTGSNNSKDRDSYNKECIDHIYHEYNWIYNVDGLDGGGLISNYNSVDAYRLALQYGIADAVIVGTHHVTREGISNDITGNKGFIWRPQTICDWDHLKAIDKDLEHSIYQQRIEYQRIGLLSPHRKYPAQIVFTWTGTIYNDAEDFLKARIFHEHESDGTLIEAYIITSQLGAINIKQRIHLYPDLQDRIDKILIIIQPTIISSTDTTHPSIIPTTDIDISLIPEILYSKYDIRIVNHDGGHKVLNAFCKAGALCQMNLTLGRKVTVEEVINSLIKNQKIVNKQLINELLLNYSNHIKKYSFFKKHRMNTNTNYLPTTSNNSSNKNHINTTTTNNNNNNSNNSNNDDDSNRRNSSYSNAMPKEFKIISMLCDENEDISIITCDIIPKKYEFYQE